MSAGISHMTTTKEEDKHKNDGMDDSWADSVKSGKDKQKERGAAASSGDAGPQGHVNEDMRVLKAKIGMVESDLREVSLGADRSQIVLNRKRSVQIKEFRNKLNTLCSDIKKDANIIHFKHAALSLDLHFCDLSDLMRDIQRVNDALKSTATESALMVAPAPAPGANPMKTPPKGLHMRVMEVYDENADWSLGKEQRIKTMWPIAEARAPKFSTEAAGVTFAHGAIGLTAMECVSDLYQ